MRSPAPSRRCAGSRSLAPRARNLTVEPKAFASADQVAEIARLATAGRDEPCLVRVFFLATPFILSVRPQQLREQSSDGVDVFVRPNCRLFVERPAVVDVFHQFHLQRLLQALFRSGL